MGYDETIYRSINDKLTGPYTSEEIDLTSSILKPIGDRLIGGVAHQYILYVNQFPLFRHFGEPIWAMTGQSSIERSITDEEEKYGHEIH